MGVRDIIRDRRAKKRKESRIKRGGKRLYRKKHEGPSRLENNIRELGSAAGSIADRMHEGVQRRKGRGRELVVERLTRGMTRANPFGSNKKSKRRKK